MQVKRILELQPASVHGRHPLGQHTPLHAAAAVGSLHVVRELLSVGGPSAAQALDEGGATPLHVACQQVRARRPPRAWRQPPQATHTCAPRPGSAQPAHRPRCLGCSARRAIWLSSRSCWLTLGGAPA